MNNNKVPNFVSECKHMSLMMNTKKTKEMIVDFRKKDNTISPILIDHDEIEIVSEYKYLGTYIDKNMD